MSVIFLIRKNKKIMLMRLKQMKCVRQQREKCGLGEDTRRNLGNLILNLQ